MLDSLAMCLTTNFVAVSPQGIIAAFAFLISTIAGVAFLLARRGMRGKLQHLVAAHRAERKEWAAREQRLLANNRELNSLVEERSHQLQAANGRYRNAFHHAAIGIAEVSVDGYFIAINEHFSGIVGYDPLEAQGMKIQDLSVAADHGLDDEQLRLLNTNAIQSYTLDKRYVHKKGHTIWVSLSVSAIRDAQGGPLYLIAVVQDISPKKAAEAELVHLKETLEKDFAERTGELSHARAALTNEVSERQQIEDKLAASNNRVKAIIDGTSDLIAAVDCDYNFIAFNTAYQRQFHQHFGIEPKIGDHLLSILAHLPADLAKQSAMWQEAMAGAPLTLVGAFAANGESHDIYEITFSHIFNTLNQLVGAAYIGRNVTARIEAESILEKAKLEAEHANATKSMFLANVSHEIRTPIGVILGYADMLLKPEIQADERIRFTSKIKRNGQNLLAIVNDILDLSKVESGHLTIDKELINLPDFVAENIVHMRSYAEKKGLALNWSVSTRIPQSIYTDSQRLRQILYNLLNNAIKFTDTGRISLDIRYRASSLEGASTMIEFLVSDTGIGIAADKQARLFQPFSQTDNSVSRKYGGTGLGLNLSRQLAKHLGGDVVLVQSGVFVGSDFAATIDAGPINAHELITVPCTQTIERHLLEEQQRSDHHSVRFPGTSILLVEDFEDNQDLYRSLLMEAGARVDVAHNGKVALTKTARNHYDLILMDMQMPVLDGYSATRELRRLGFHQPIVALTANAMHGEMQRCLEAGCSDFLTKPVDRRQMIDTLLRLVNQTPAAAPAVASNAPVSNHPASNHPASDPALAVLVDTFVNKLPHRIRAMEIMYKNCDIDGVRSLAHQLRGAGGGYGFPEITTWAAKIEGCQEEGEELLAHIEKLRLICQSIHAGHDC